MEFVAQFVSRSSLSFRFGRATGGQAVVVIVSFHWL
jgi:hypothetical protein